MKNQFLEPGVSESKEIFQELLEKAQEGLQIEKIAVSGYEKVLKVTNTKVGLHAFIAIHNTALGPALGGTRVQLYSNFDAALEDALRLAKGMTYKSALAELGLGGGKSVIIADPKGPNKKELMRAFGAAVEQLKGEYICAEDMGCSVEDVNTIRQVTQYVVGLPNENSSGNPAPFTAWGTFRGIQSVVKQLYKTDSLEGKSVAIQGLGSVGEILIDHLFWAGAHLIVTDIDMEKATRLAKKYRARMVLPEDILKVDCDVLSPCAGGGVINEETVRLLRCKAVAGCANNQLLSDFDADLLKARGILYAPDFVINAGGLLNVAVEIEEEGYNPRIVHQKVHRIYDKLLSIYDIAERNKESTHTAALALANHRIRYAIGKRVIPPKFHHKLEV